MQSSIPRGPHIHFATDEQDRLSSDLALVVAGLYALCSSRRIPNSKIKLSVGSPVGNCEVSPKTPSNKTSNIRL